LKTPVVVALLLCAASCATPQPAPSKIRFDLAQFRPDGLRGPPDGLTSLTYEFIIPDKGAYIMEVKRIDPSLQISPGVRGRSGGGPGKVLCTGSTHQKNFRAILERLAALPYVGPISECFFEK
jgi:hypothetical protein